MESRISKLGMKLVRHLDLANREPDGAVHWKSVGPSCDMRFKNKEDVPSLILNGLMISGKGTPAAFYLKFAQFKGVLEET